MYETETYHQRSVVRGIGNVHGGVRRTGRHFGIDTGTAERVGVRSRSADRGADAYDAHLYRMVEGWVEGSGELYQ